MKKLLSLVLVIAMVVCTVPVVFAADLITGLSGEGTEASPVLIGSTADWATYAASGQVGSGVYVQLTADLDFAGAAPAKVAGTFAGNFDGNNHVIKNIKIDGANDTTAALFEKISDTAVIHNLGIEEVEVVASSAAYTSGWVAILAATSAGGTIENCYISGIKSTSSGFAWNKAWGGFIGHTWWATGSKGVVIKNSYVLTKAGHSGYLAADAYSTPNGNFFSPFVSYIDDRANSHITIENCYTDLDTVIYNNISNFTPTATNTYYNTDNNTGRSRVNYPLGTAKTTNDLQTEGFAAANLGSAFKDGGVETNFYPALAWQNVTTSLIDGIPGFGTQAKPVKIGSVADWSTFVAAVTADATLLEGYYYELTADLDFNNAEIAMVPGTFKSVLDGKNHVLKNYKINGLNGVYGVFNEVSNVTIKNIGFVDVTVTPGSGSNPQTNYVGVVARVAKGGTYFENAFISGIKVESTITWQKAWGGFVGHSWWGTDTGVNFTNCYFLSKAGQDGYITLDSMSGPNQEYFAPFVSFIDDRAGSKINITNCYADVDCLIAVAPANFTPVATNSYYNTENSTGRNRVTATLGTAKTTAELKSADMVATLGAAFQAGGVETNGYPALAFETVTPFPSSIIDGLYGMGTESDPVLISSVADWKIFIAVMNNAVEVDSAGKFFEITADLDFAGEVISHPDSTFYGTLDGKNHVIKNFVVDGTNSNGLFWCLNKTAVIKNLGMVDVTIAPITNSYNGAFAGRMRAASSLENCFVNGIKLSSNCSVWNAGFGGLTGQVFWANTAPGVSFTNCYVVSRYGETGYLTSANISASPNDGYFGAFVGSSAANNTINLTNCYTDLDVLVSTVNTQSGYSTTFNVSNSYYNNDIVTRNGRTSCGTGKSVAEMLDPSFVTTLGGAYKAGGQETLEYPALSWQTVTPPVTLIAGLAGAGTEAKPVQIGSVADWNTMAAALNANADLAVGYYYELTADIDFAGAEPTYITNTFKSVLDGKGHVVKNYKINGLNSKYALFTQISSCTFKNIGFEDVTIVPGTGSNPQNNYVAAVARTAQGSTYFEKAFIRGIKVESTITWEKAWGGFIGHSWWATDANGIHFTDCYFVSKAGQPGYVTLDSMSGPNQEYFGPFVSFIDTQNNSKIHLTNCYADVNCILPVEANVLTNTNNYYNKENSTGRNRVTATIGTGLTAYELRLAAGTLGSAYKYATSNADNCGFPKLAWEANVADTNDGVVFKNIINNVEDLKIFATLVNASADGFAGQTVVLNADLNLTGITWTSNIGTSEVPFQGTFDGKGHTISNLAYTTNSVSNEALGIFAYVGGYAYITNVGLENVSFLESSSYASYPHDIFGGLVAHLLDNARVSECYVKNATIDTKTLGTSHWSGFNGDQLEVAGALIGVVNGEGVVITNCYAVNAQILDSSASAYGAIVGRIDNINEMRNCYSTTLLGNVATKGDYNMIGKVVNSYCVDYDWFRDGRWIGNEITADEMKNIAQKLGGKFAYDKNNINGGFPTLAWERGFAYVASSVVEDDTLVSIKVANYANVAGKVVVAAYDSNDLLLGTKVADLTAEGGSVAIGLDITGAAKVKAFILKADGEATPIATPNAI